MNRAAWKAIVRLLLATALFRMSQNMAMTTFSLLGKERLGLSPGTLGILGALSGLSLVVSTVAISAWVHPRRGAAAAWVGAGILVVSLVAFYFASTLSVLVVAVALLGVSGGIALPALVNAVVVSATANRERVIAIYTITLSASLAVGPLLETLILHLSHQDVRLPFILFIVLPILGLVLLAPPALSGVRSTPANSSAGLVTEEAPQRPRLKREKSAPRRLSLLHSKGGRVALIVQLLYAVPFAGITVFGALVSRIGFGVSAADAQLAFTIFFIVSFVARAFVAWKAPIVEKGRLIWLSVGLTIFGIALLGLGNGLGALLIAMGTLGIPHGLTFPLSLTLVAEASTPEQLARANATLLGSTNLLGVVVPLILGAVIPWLGYQGMVLVILIPVAAFTLLLFLQTTTLLTSRRQLQ